MKKSSVRVICAVFAFAILVCAFSACGGTKEEVSSATKTTSSSEVIVEANKADYTGWENFDPYATISDDIKGNTVRFATWIDHTSTEGAVPLANFEKDTGLKVALYTVSQSGYVDKLMTNIASGDIPDVFVNSEDDQNFPLTLQIAQPVDLCSTVNLKEPIWDQTMLATGTIGGHVYYLNTIGSPWSGSNLCYFNKSLFEENGFKTPAEYYEEGTWTWDTMLKVLKDIRSLGNDYQGGYIDNEVLGDSAGVSFCMYDYKTNKFSSGVDKDELVTTYQYICEAREAGLINGNKSSFIKGKTGIILIGVYGLKNTGHFKDMDPNDIGYTYLPSLQDGTKGRVSSVYRLYGIIEGAPNADAAGYFIRYWLDPDNYDLQNTFITPEAGVFYYDLINTVADQKYFNFDDATCYLIGAKKSEVFYKGARGTSAANVAVKIKEVSNLVDDACAAANQIIQSKIDKYK